MLMPRRTRLVEPLLAMRCFLVVHLPMLEQMALFDFMNEGHYARHLRHMLHHYSRRRSNSSNHSVAFFTAGSTAS
jgi:DNA-binding transcriptional MocR family regulator